MVEPIVVGQTGDYHVFLNPHADATGSVTVRAYTVPADIVHDVAVDGTPDPCVFTIPGQNGKIRFAGSAGQEVSINLGSTVADTDYQILKPNGNELDVGLVRQLGRLHRSVLAAPSTAHTSSCSTRRASCWERHRDALRRSGRRDRAGAIGSTTVNTVWHRPARTLR